MLRNLIGGLRVALLRPIRNPDTAGSPHVLGPLALALLLHAGFSLWRQDGTTYFNDAALGYLSASLLAIAAYFFAVTRHHGRIDLLPAVLAVFTSALPWFVIVLSGIWIIIESVAAHYTFLIAALLWLVLIVLRSTRVVLQKGSLMVVVAAILVTASIPLAAVYRGAGPGLYYSFGSDEAEDGGWERYAEIDTEHVFYNQPQLLDTSLQKVAAGNPQETEVFFIGFAGNGDEAVFASEARFAQAVINDRYRAESRSLVLVNDLEALDAEPLANTHNLFRSIEHLAIQMDLDDDILVAVLTSHGSEDAALDISLYPFDLRSLQADALRSSLDSAGVVWRILIVSACYSGSFIEPLKTEQTLIITAAAHDRNSFGCSNDRELTYFGEAYFRDAFAVTDDFVAAFDHAKRIVARREAEEDRTPSNPQLWIGDAMAEKLRSLTLD